MTANVVEITVKATDEAGPGFDSAKAKSAGLAGSMDELAVAQDRVTQAENKLREAQIQQTDAQMKLEELQKSGNASATELAAAQDKVTTATIRAADAQLRLGEADARLVMAEKGAGDAAQVQAAKTDEAAAAASRGGREFALFGGGAALALGAAGYEAVKMSMSFQSAMERLVTQAGLPQKELGALKSGVLSLAGSVGFDPNSLATSLYHVASNMASLGATAPKMLDVVRIAAEGARVGGAGLEDVTNALTAAIASGIPGVQNFSQAMGALNAIVGAGDMKMQDLAEAMGTGVLATVKGYGLSLKDVGAALATFGDNNIRGANAATDLRMAVQALAVPAAAGKKALEGIGLSMTSLGDTMRQHGLLAALEELQHHFKAAGVTAKEQGDLITEIFGKKAGTGLNVLMDQLDRVKSKYPAITDAANQFGSAWQKTGQTLSQQWDQIRATFDALLVSLGQKLIPVLSSIAGFLLRHEEIIKKLAPYVLAVVGAFLALKVAMSAIEAVRSLGPTGLAIMAIAAATVLVIQHWKTISHVAAEAWGAALRVIKEVWNGIWNAVIGPVVRAFDAVKSFITGSFDGWWRSHGEEIKQVWNDVWNAIKMVTTVAWTVITADVKAGWGALMDVLKPGMDALNTLFKASWDAISAVFKAAWAIISGIVKIALAAVKTDIKVTWDLVVGIFNVFLDLITGHWSKAWHDIQNTATQVLNAVKGFLGSAWNDMKSTAIAAWNALFNGVKSILGNLLGLISRLPGEILHALGDLGHLLWDAGRAIIQGLIDGIKSMIGSLGNVVSGIGHFIASLKGPLPADLVLLVPHGRAIMQGLMNGIASRMPDLRNQLAGITGAIGGTQVPVGGGGGAGGGHAAQVVLQLMPAAGGSGLEQLFWTWLKQGVRAQGGDPRVFTRKVAFL